MSYEFDRYESNQIAANDREESRSARRFASEHGGARCYGPHHMASDGAGGGRCTECDESVSGAEL